MIDPDHVEEAKAVYDAAAEKYVQVIGTELSAAFEGPIERGFLEAFVQSVEGTAGRVADVGCGPGRVAALLASHGLDVTGVDLSLAMLDFARGAHPHIRFQEGRLTSLPFQDGSVDGVVCWYSIIHTPPANLSEVFSEVHRVLSETGCLLVAFQAGGGEGVQRRDAYGTGLPMTSFRHSPEEVARFIVASGLEVHARAVRQPQLDHELTPQAFILAVHKK